jgi:hypothetical protein
MLLYVDANFASPYALVAFVSLIEKGLEFEIEPDCEIFVLYRQSLRAQYH